jgi:hypothetical protein
VSRTISIVITPLLWHLISDNFQNFDFFAVYLIIAAYIYLSLGFVSLKEHQV